MKKCKYCDHYGHTEKGEEVCTKYLLYIGEDKEELYCREFEVTFNAKRFVMVTVILLVVLLAAVCL